MTYDLHITVDPATFTEALLPDTWKVLDIHNVQGPPHYIVSCKYTGRVPHLELEQMVTLLRRADVSVLRKKIELHFRRMEDVELPPNSVGIVEVHYKYKQRGVFSPTEEQIAELNRKKLALAFNLRTERCIVSARFANLLTYEEGKAANLLPYFLEEEEREVVTMDDNNALDAFWPLRTPEDSPLSFGSFPDWIPWFKT